MPHTIVKLGGSFYRDPELDRLLDAAMRGGAAVAPGGGGFADHVRAAQAVHGFSEPAAHAMAILAMEQAAHLLADRAPALVRCAAAADFAAAERAGAAALWFPAMLALRADVPASWAVTSDSLALWLARELGAPRLILLKNAAVGTEADPAAWAAAGLVDPWFPKLAESFRGDILCLGPATPSAFEAALATPARRAARRAA